MIISDTNLSSGLEDYIEAIYIAELENKKLKGADLARKLEVSRASVSEAISKLNNKGIVTYNSYEFITLTSEGKNLAKQVYQKHNILNDFFQNILKIEQPEASENACKIEHIISKNVLEKIEIFTIFLKKHKTLLHLFLEESEQKQCPEYHQ